MTPSTGKGSGGADKHAVVLYGLSTCVWCRKMREYLESEAVEFDIIYVDQLEGAEREAALEQVKRWNPATTFPTVVVDDVRSVNGYKPDEAREVLGL
jgi:glutaredoxin